MFPVLVLVLLIAAPRGCGDRPPAAASGERLAGEPLASERLELRLVVAQGGINPGETSFALASDGTVAYRASRLAGPPPVEETWTVGADGVERIRRALAAAGFDGMPESLNRAQGAQQAFTTRLEITAGGSRRAVEAFTFGTPPPPERWLELLAALRDVLTLGGTRPSR